MYYIRGQPIVKEYNHHSDSQQASNQSKNAIVFNKTF
jgi:hypothetical protein